MSKVVVDEFRYKISVDSTNAYLTVRDRVVARRSVDHVIDGDDLKHLFRDEIDYFVPNPVVKPDYSRANSRSSCSSESSTLLGMFFA